MTEKERKKIINEGIEILEKGGVILYPTDTIWGIGCDATNKKAIEKVYSIKKRSHKKPLIILGQFLSKDSSIMVNIDTYDISTWTKLNRFTFNCIYQDNICLAYHSCYS